MFGTQIDHPMTVTTPVRADPAATDNGFAKLRVLEWKLVENKGRFFVPDFVWFVLTAQEELEALLWICFTPDYMLLIFFEKIFF